MKLPSAATAVEDYDAPPPDPKQFAQIESGIYKLQGGIVYHINRTHDRRYCELIVGPQFYELSFEQKALIAKSCSYYAANGHGYASVSLLDYSTHDDVGSWSQEYGLRLKQRR